MSYQILTIATGAAISALAAVATDGLSVPLTAAVNGAASAAEALIQATAAASDAAGANTGVGSIVGDLGWPVPAVKTVYQYLDPILTGINEIGDIQKHFMHGDDVSEPHLDPSYWNPTPTAPAIVSDLSTIEGYSISVSGYLIELLGQFVANVAFRSATSPLFYVLGLVGSGNSLTQSPVAGPSVNLANILSTDTILIFLEREAPTYTWELNTLAQGYVAAADPTIIGLTWMFSLSVAEFDYLQHYLYTPTSGPPVRSTLGDLMTLLAMLPISGS